MTTEEKQMIRSIFQQIREDLNDFFTERDFQLSNAQIFTFLSFCPNALAIASDGKVDEQEIIALEQISRSIHVDSMVSIELFEMMSYASEPANCIINEEFNMRSGSELLYLSRNMKKYEKAFVSAIKALLKFDANPASENSMTNTFMAMMSSVIDNNGSLDKDEELKKLKQVQKELGLVA